MDKYCFRGKVETVMDNIYGKLLVCKFDEADDILNLTDDFVIDKENRLSFSVYVKLNYTKNDVGKKVLLLLMKLTKENGNKKYNCALLKEYTLLGEENENEQREFKRKVDRDNRIRINSLDHEMTSKYNVRNFPILGAGEYALVLKMEEDVEEKREIRNSDSILDAEYFLVQ